MIATVGLWLGLDFNHHYMVNHHATKLIFSLVISIVLIISTNTANWISGGRLIILKVSKIFEKS